MKLSYKVQRAEILGWVFKVWTFNTYLAIISVAYQSSIFSRTFPLNIRSLQAAVPCWKLAESSVMSIRLVLTHVNCNPTTWLRIRLLVSNDPVAKDFLIFTSDSTTIKSLIFSPTIQMGEPKKWTRAKVPRVRSGCITWYVDPQFY